MTRYALYVLPAPGSALDAFGQSVLGIHGATAASVPRPPGLDELAAECVAALDSLRAPLSEAERARRRPERLSARGRALLDRWGYPHVFEAFRFHMTLTDALCDEDRDRWHARLARAYAASGPEPLTIDAVCLLRQDDGDDGDDGRDGSPAPRPFRLLARIPFGGHDGRSPGT